MKVLYDVGLIASMVGTGVLNLMKDSLTLIADDTMKMTQLNELLRKYLASRKVEQGAFVFGEPETAGGGTFKQIVSIKQGIDTELARKITKAIKGAKMKVQPQAEQESETGSCHAET